MEKTDRQPVITNTEIVIRMIMLIKIFTVITQKDIIDTMKRHMRSRQHL